METGDFSSYPLPILPSASVVNRISTPLPGGVQFTYLEMTLEEAEPD